MLQAELEHPNHSISQPYVITAAPSSASMLRGRMGDIGVEIMLDLGACIPLVREDTATHLSGLQLISVHIVLAMGEIVLSRVTLPV